MPGGRLTREDRERIAEGVSAGLPYAEIARQVQRPTSTVSREVRRNGGRERYRADRANRATRRRARRPRPSGGSATDPAGAPGRDHEAVRRFTEQFTAMMAQSGVPRMPARVLVCLLTSDSGCLTARQLVQRLQVSPASISKAIRYLEAVGLVRRERTPGQRRENYRVGEDVWYEVWLRREQYFAHWEHTAREGAEVLGLDTPPGARLDEMSRFFGLIRRDIAHVTEHWRRTRSAEGTDGTAASRLARLPSLADDASR